jgi:hypothetical protein
MQAVGITSDYMALHTLLIYMYLCTLCSAYSPAAESFIGVRVFCYQRETTICCPAQQWRTQEFFFFGGGGVQQIQLRIEGRENGDLGGR